MSPSQTIILALFAAFAAMVGWRTRKRPHTFADRMFLRVAALMGVTAWALGWSNLGGFGDLAFVATAGMCGAYALGRLDPPRSADDRQ